jgi:hypothetical protein
MDSKLYVAILFCVQSFQILYVYLFLDYVRLSQWFDGADGPIFGQWHCIKMGCIASVPATVTVAIFKGK